MAEDGRVTVKAILDTGDVAKGIRAMSSGLSGISADGLKDVCSEAGKAADALEKAGGAAGAADGGFTVMRGTLAGLASEGIGAAASAVRDLAAGVVDLGARFSSSMSNVAALSGATGDELARLEGLAREMGAATTYSASQAADALGYMALAGWDASEMASGLPGVLQLAQAGQMDLAAASDLCTDYLSAFGMGAADTQRMVDVLAYAQGNANTNTEQLGMAFKNCAANANAAGLDVETTTAAIAMLSNQGLKGSEAGTALAAIMRDMTAKMEDGAIAIGDASVAVQDSQGDYRDFAAIMADVEAATDGMGEAEKAAALQSTFTADSIRGLNLVLNAGAGELAAFRDELYGSSGAAADMAATMTDNLAGDLSEMGSAFEELGLKAFDAAEGPLRSLVQFVTSTVVPGLEGLLGVVEEYGPQMAAAAAGVAGLMALRQVAPAARDAAEGLADMARQGELASSAAGVLQGACANLAGALAGVLVADVAGQLMEYQGLLEDARGATEGMAAALAEVDGGAASAALDGAASSADEAKAGFEQVARATHDATKAQADVAEGISEAFGEINAGAATLDRVTGVMSELAGRSGLTAGEQARLAAAVEEYNDVTGASVSVIDAQTGTLSASTQAILGNAEAWEANARAQAAQEALGEVYRQQAQNAAQLDAVNKKLEESSEGWGVWVGDFAVAADQASVEYHDLVNQQNTLMEQQDALKATEEGLTGQLAASAEEAARHAEAQAECAGAAEGAAGAAKGAAAANEGLAESAGTVAEMTGGASERLAEMAEAVAEYAGGNASFAQALADSGYGVQGFAAALVDAGVEVGTFEAAVEGLAGTTQNAFSVMEQQEAVSVDQMIANLQENQAAVEAWRANVAQLYEWAGEDVRASGFVKAMAEMGPQCAAQLDEIVSAGEERFGQLASTWAAGMDQAVQAAVTQYGIGADALLAGTDVTLAELAAKVAEGGQTVADIGLMGADAFAGLADSLGLSVDQMAAACDALGVALDGSVRSAVAGAAAAVSEEAPAVADAAASMEQGAEDAARPMEEGVPASAEAAMQGAQGAIDSSTPGIVGAAQALESGVEDAVGPVQEGVPGKFQAAWAAALDNTGSAAAQIAAKAEEGRRAAESATRPIETSLPQSWQAAMARSTEHVKKGETQWPQSAKAGVSKYASAIRSGQGAASSSAGAVASAAGKGLDKAKAKAKGSGSGTGSSFAGGVRSQTGAANGAGFAVASSAGSGLRSCNGSAWGWGAGLGSNFASGVRAQAGAAAAAGSAVAAAAAAPLRHSIAKVGPLHNGGKGEMPWGEHLVQNFASGVRSAKSLRLVGAASDLVARQVVDYLGHSSPRKGALKGGEWVYGYHAALNLASGLEDGKGAVGDAASEVADAAAEHFAAMVASYRRTVDEVKGASSDLSAALKAGAEGAAEYRAAAPAFAGGAVYASMKKLESAGYDLKSYSKAQADFEKKKSDWDKKFADFDEKQADAEKDYRARLDKQQASRDKSVKSARDAYDKAVARAEQAKADAERKADKKYAEAYKKYLQLEGEYDKAQAAYEKNRDKKKAESLKKKAESAEKKMNDQIAALNSAYDSYSETVKKQDQAVKDAAKARDEKIAEAASGYDEAVRELREAQAEKAADQAESLAEAQAEYAEWRKEYDAFQALSGSLTATMEQLDEGSDLYKVTDDLMGGIGGAQALTGALEKLSKKGVGYTQAFVEAMVDGGDEYRAALLDMADMTGEEVQSFVDAFGSLAIAEREEGIAARELAATHRKVASQAQRDKEAWLDYRESVVDVREAIDGDAGLALAFRHAGTSVEGLAADLLSLDVQMDDLASTAADWGAKVSDGFSPLSSLEQTGAADYVSNLKNNMAETAQYTANLKAVFGKLGDTALAETEAFRQAVLEGGFEQYAGLMADMAAMDAAQVMEVIGLYNESIQQGLQDSIEQFQALAPGEEMMLATIEGIEGKAGELHRVSAEAATGGAEAAAGAAPEYFGAGASLGGSLAAGVASQAGAIAAAAASAVSGAMAGAKAQAAAAASSLPSSPAKAAPAARSVAPLKAGVDWYATGGVFDKAAIVGVAERGREAVVPLSGDAMRPFAKAVAGEMGGGGSVTVNVNISRFENRSDRDLDEIVDYVNRRIASKARTETKSRGKAWA
ncbi:phage tail tape measure protein [Eggerthellaceae bacterium zg-893]|nr:phage tail tape measure protein [Eggerthellaceae bacterium zg-893]